MQVQNTVILGYYRALTFMEYSVSLFIKLLRKMNPIYPFFL